MYGLNWEEAAEQAQPKYKVGQLVRVVKDGCGGGGSLHGADVGSVHTIGSFDEGYYQGDDDWYFNPDEIQPAFLPGDRVRVTRHGGYFSTGDVGEVERQSDTAVYVRRSGWAALPIDADALELIAEPEAGNKEQLGLTDDIFKRIGIAVLIDQPCIVARVLDGTPRPSNVPFVHADVASATTEAERLAKNNPGQEFAVYQRVAGRVAEVSYSMKEVA